MLRGHDFWVNQVKFSPKGDVIASCGLNGTAILWRAATAAQAASQREAVTANLVPHSAERVASHTHAPPWNPHHGQFHSGITALENELRTSPRSAMALARLAVLHGHLGNHGQASEYVEQLLSVYETDGADNPLSADAQLSPMACVLEP